MARARNQPHPGLALLVWVLAVLLLALTARLATAAPAHSANPNVATDADDNAARSSDVDKVFDCFADDHDDTDAIDHLDGANDLDGANELACTDAYDLDDATPETTAPLDVAELADNDDPIALEDFVLDEDASEDTSSVIATEQREALRRRRRSRFGHVDLSLGWRRTMAVRDVIDARNEVWLTATWRL